MSLISGRGQASQLLEQENARLKRIVADQALDMFKSVTRGLAVLGGALNFADLVVNQGWDPGKAFVVASLQTLGGVAGGYILGAVVCGSVAVVTVGVGLLACAFGAGVIGGVGGSYFGGKFGESLVGGR